ncbi:zinc-dependent alcohol dehydrogenase [Clostridium beijerinckii]|uniref:zinc-dependent alcohol dehydrogenase n=1 Tax=Clostridium beijerinckii TaxID=1520 RepID=UPI0013610BB3|nr:zinc-binding dehydrogenase [Clostridium beijerinckii]MZK52084.1 zinc-binding dehydrogenase [Clostridium beijerinckii]MZK60225.1 zinc-binding dehydrogenase [Clostridium beijerinckii]MZK70510.1 zinc-binding dehydrogenase [Clostridium beijerinckii]MZK75812.1 zinc-binding dehydrogenase [Clostridium beijerinckii]MZK85476.1 zinc-binding dehydrogenase [Clostridium beijerinckii]
MQTGRVAMLVDKRKFEIQEYEIPEITDDQILLKVEGCGVCGTDAHEYKNDPFGIIPIVLGHEGTGEIVKIGKNITCDTIGKPLKVGDKIVTSVFTCGTCGPCRDMPSRPNLCDNLGCYGLMTDDKTHFNGYFGEYLVLRKGSSVFNVSAYDLDARVLIEPFAVAVHALERAKTTGLLKFNSKVVIQGCGPIGLCMLATVRTLGITDIIAIDGSDSRLEIAKELGASHTFNFTEYNSFDAMKDKIEQTIGSGADFAFQCTGVPSAASNVYKLVRRGGGACEVGFFVNNGECSINPHFDFCNKEITLVGSWAYSVEDYPKTIALMDAMKNLNLPYNKLITHRYSLDEITEALEMNLSMQGIKVAIFNK